MNVSITKTLLQVTLFATTLFLWSCGNFQKPDETKVLAGEQANENVENDMQDKDVQFLVKAAEINLKEIQLGQLAQEKSKAADIKELGRMMEDAHTKSFNDLEVLAQSKMVEIPNAPTEEAQDACNALNDKTGNDFDRAFSQAMESAHKDAIEIFEKASTDCNDMDIRNWALATLPELRSHLSYSIASQKDYVKLNTMRLWPISRKRNNKSNFQ